MAFTEMNSIGVEDSARRKSGMAPAIMVGIAGILVILSSAIIFLAARAASLQANNITIAESAQAVNNILNTTTSGSNLSAGLGSNITGMLGKNLSAEIYYAYQNSSVNSLNSQAKTGYLLGVMALADGLLMLVSAFFINKEAYRSKKWPILGFAFSAVSIFFGGGFIIGFFLGMGGAFVGMGASMKSKKFPVDNGV